MAGSSPGYCGARAGGRLHDELRKVARLNGIRVLRGKWSSLGMQLGSLSITLDLGGHPTAPQVSKCDIHPVAVEHNEPGEPIHWRSAPGADERFERFNQMSLKGATLSLDNPGKRA